MESHGRRNKEGPFTIKPITKDGDCMFGVAAVHMYGMFLSRSQMDAKVCEIRNRVCSEVSSHPEAYNSFFTSTGDSDMFSQYQDLCSWLDGMKKKGIFGDNVALAVITLLYGFDAVIWEFDSETNRATSTTLSSSKPTNNPSYGSEMNILVVCDRKDKDIPKAVLKLFQH